MEGVIGSSFGVFIGLTLILFGGAAFLTGQAVAGTWRPYWQVIPYSMLLAAANRFLAFALFDGELLHLGSYIFYSLIHIAIASAAFRLTRVQQMVSQYSWLYERSGIFGWRERTGT